MTIIYITMAAATPHFGHYFIQCQTELYLRKSTGKLIGKNIYKIATKWGARQSVILSALYTLIEFNVISLTLNFKSVTNDHMI